MGFCFFAHFIKTETEKEQNETNYRSGFFSGSVKLIMQIYKGLYSYKRVLIAESNRKYSLLLGCQGGGDIAQNTG
jgi:hypothetical protein